MTPDDADRHVAAGLEYLAANRFAEAEAEARQALALRQTHADAIHLLGVVAWRTGRLAEAAQLIAATVAAVPAYADGFRNLGLVLREMGQPGKAIACFRQAASLEPAKPEAHFLLATMLREIGETDAALNLYRRVLTIDPSHVDALNDLGAALKDRRQLDEAIELFRRAVVARPDHVVALVNLGSALMDRGEPLLARQAFARARALAPERADARFGYCLSFVPICYATEAEIVESRAAYTAELAALAAHYRKAPAEELTAAAASVGEHLPFYLAYQGEDDLELQRRFGTLFARVMAAGHPDLAQRLPMPPLARGEKIRVGIVSGFFRSHSVWKLFGGWVREMDRGRFALYGYSTATRRDEETPRAAAAFDGFVENSPSFDGLAAAIRARNLHVLIYPEIGMDQTTARLAALRLAPVQAVAWGHPETTGLPTIDHFLSSDLMEPPDADVFYAETLVRLPNLSIHYAPFEIAPARPDLAASGVRPDAVKYLCCQSLYKYLPRNDDIYPRIAASMPEAQFLFIRHHSAPGVTETMQKRLHDAFRAAGLDPARHLVFLPPLAPPLYAGLNLACDAYLDSLEWSGGNTTLEAAAAGLPIVTLPGRLMRGRHSAAILTMMGLAETIARDKDDYVALAARLGRDAAWRREIAAKVAANRHRLYRDEAPVRALEALIEGWVGAR